jgi:hypothetical protein
MEEILVMRAGAVIDKVEPQEVEIRQDARPQACHHDCSTAPAQAVLGGGGQQVAGWQVSNEHEGLGRGSGEV